MKLNEIFIKLIPTAEFHLLDGSPVSQKINEPTGNKQVSFSCTQLLKIESSTSTEQLTWRIRSSRWNTRAKYVHILTMSHTAKCHQTLSHKLHILYLALIQLSLPLTYALVIIFMCFFTGEHWPTYYTTTSYYHFYKFPQLIAHKTRCFTSPIWSSGWISSHKTVGCYQPNAQSIFPRIFLWWNIVFPPTVGQAGLKTAQRRIPKEPSGDTRGFKHNFSSPDIRVPTIHRIFTW